MNSEVAKLIAEHGQDAYDAANKIEELWRDAFHWNDGHQNAFQQSIRIIGEVKKGAKP